jgi:hypothetical protein
MAVGHLPGASISAEDAASIFADASGKKSPVAGVLMFSWQIFRRFSIPSTRRLL